MPVVDRRLDHAGGAGAARDRCGRTLAGRHDATCAIAGLPEERIIRIPTSDNFWRMGDTGPCGPCSEIFYDHGPAIPGGPPGSPDEDGDRFIEIWNLVFMLFEEGPEQIFLRHRLLAEAVRSAVSVWTEGQVLSFNIAEAGERGLVEGRRAATVAGGGAGPAGAVTAQTGAAVVARWRLPMRRWDGLGHPVAHMERISRQIRGIGAGRLEMPVEALILLLHQGVRARGLDSDAARSRITRDDMKTAKFCLQCKQRGGSQRLMALAWSNVLSRACRG